MKSVNKGSKAILHGPRPHTLSATQRKVTKALQIVVLVGLMLAFMPTAISSTAMAEVPGEDFAVQNTLGMGMVIIGIVLACVVVGLYGFGTWNAAESTWGGILIAVIIIIIIAPVALGAAVYLEGEEGQKPYCELHPDDPSCQVQPSIKWDVQLEADLDVAGNTYPASPMTAVDTAIGGTTGEWASGDNGNMDMANMRVTSSYTIDTDLDDTEALWAEPNGIFIEASRMQLLDGPRASSGALETQHYFARIDHISVTKLVTDNESIQYGAFYQDLSGRWHIGYQYEDGSWAEACPEYRGKDLPTTGCAAIPVGTDAGTGDTTGAIASAGFRIWWIWEDRGPFGHNHLDGATWSITFSIGSESDWHTFTFIATMTESATNNS